MSEQISTRDDSRQYPAALIESVLGAECVAQLRQAKPKQYSDIGFMRDRNVINPGALGYWLYLQFGLNIFNDLDSSTICDVDPLAERVTIGVEAYNLPHWCYLSLGVEPGDQRPTTWPGIPRPSHKR